MSARLARRFVETNMRDLSVHRRREASALFKRLCCGFKRLRRRCREEVLVLHPDDRRHRRHAIVQHKQHVMTGRKFTGRGWNRYLSPAGYDHRIDRNESLILVGAVRHRRQPHETHFRGQAGAGRTDCDRLAVSSTRRRRRDHRPYCRVSIRVEQIGR